MNHLILQKGYFSLEKNKRFFIIKRYMLKAAAKGASELPKAAAAAGAGVPQHVSSNPNPTNVAAGPGGEAPILTTGTTQGVSNKPIRPTYENQPGLKNNPVPPTTVEKLEADAKDSLITKNLNRDKTENEEKSEAKFGLKDPEETTSQTVSQNQEDNGVKQKITEELAESGQKQGAQTASEYFASLPKPTASEKPLLEYEQKVYHLKGISEDLNNPHNKTHIPHHIVGEGVGYNNQGDPILRNAHNLSSKDSFFSKDPQGNPIVVQNDRVHPKQFKSEEPYQKMTPDGIDMVVRQHKFVNPESVKHPEVLKAAQEVQTIKALYPTHNLTTGCARRKYQIQKEEELARKAEEEKKKEEYDEAEFYAKKEKLAAEARKNATDSEEIPIVQNKPYKTDVVDASANGVSNTIIDSNKESKKTNEGEET